MENFHDYTAYLHRAVLLVEKSQIDDLVAILYEAYLKNRVVFVVGNGGSAANASHFAQDLAKGTRVSLDYPKRIKALSLTDNMAFICALGNDDGFEQIFEQQLQTYANTGDVLIAISGSGNSPNIINAVKWANANQLVTVGITGFDGGLLREINQYSLHVPLNDMGTSESIHTIIFHYITAVLKEKMKKEETLAITVNKRNSF